MASGVGPGEHGEKTGIWIINVLSATPRQIRGDAEGAVPSPDGKLVAFRHTQGVSVVEANGENARSILAVELGTAYGKLQWSPDGDRLAVMVRHVGDNAGAIQLIDIASGERKELLRRDRLRSYVWLADGRFIYAVQESSGGGGSVLYAIEEGGKEQRLEVSSDMSVADMSASTDAHRIAMVRAVEQTDVYFTESSKREPEQWRRVTLDDRDDIPSDFDPRGEVVLFSSMRNGNLDVFRQRLDSPLPDLIAGGPERQSGAQFAPNGAGILYWSRAEGPAIEKLMSVPAAGGTPQALFEINGEAKFRCRGAGGCAVAVLSQAGLSVSTFDPKTGERHEPKDIKLASPPGAWNVSSTAAVAFTTADSIEVKDQTGQGWKTPLQSLPGKVTDLSFVESSGNLLVTTTASTKNALVQVDPRGAKPLLQDRRELSAPLASPDGRKLLFGVKTNSSNVWMVDGI